jgi:hypothetical protein
MKIVLAIFTFIFSISSQAATCTAGEAGKVKHSSGNFEYCNGSNWINMKNTANGACTEEGKISYQGSNVQVCDGSTWYKTGTTVVTTCTAGESGKIRYSSSQVQYCDGTNWRHVGVTDKNFWGTGADGALNTAMDTNVCDATTDGSACVMQYTNLTVNAGHTLTTQVRRKGLIIYVSGDAVINGKISMTARGANADPVAAGVPAGGLKIVRYTSATANVGTSDLSGTGSTVESGQASVTSGTAWTFARAGGSGGAANNIGGSSTTSSGGGAGGNSSYGAGGAGSAGTVFSGGSGGGGGGLRYMDMDGVCEDVATAGGAATANGGAGGAGAAVGVFGGCNSSASGTGGGAGNPGGIGRSIGGGVGNAGGTGTGGLLILFVRGNLTIGATGSIESKGMSGGSGTLSDGGGSGGGSILILYAGSLSNSGVVSAAGGSGVGRAGGNGSVRGPIQILP